MKKITIILTVLALSAMVAAPAIAGVEGTRHDMLAMGVAAGALGVTDRGVCSYCHVPHGAQGDRLWAALPGTGLTVVGNLCYSCHTVDTVVGTSTGRNMVVVGNVSHAYVKASLNAGRFFEGVNITATGYPYTLDADLTIDCTSCHDVHAQQNGGAGFRPFLQTTYDAICIACHSRNEAGTMSGNLTGSHPVGAAYTGARATAPVNNAVWGSASIYAHIVAPGNATNTSPLPADTWVIGGKKLAAGGITCVTCHMPHGKDPVDAVGPGAETPENDYLYFLKVNNITQSADFCESCHSANPGAAATASHPAAATTEANGFHGDYSGAAYAITADPMAATLWSAPSAPYVAVTASHSYLTCMGCHDTHYGEPNTPNLLNKAGAITNMGTEFCMVCHVDPVVNGTDTGTSGHHPANGEQNFDVAGFRAVSNVSEFGTIAGGIYCTTCHRAHNADATGGLGGGQMLLTGANWAAGQLPTSQMCVDCHSVVPGTYMASSVQAGMAVKYAASQRGSHYVAQAEGTIGAPPGLQPMDTSHTAAVWVAGGYSKWGGDAFNFTSGAYVNGDVLCESCHSMQFSLAGANDALILGTFYSAVSNTDTGDLFCLGCHGAGDGVIPPDGTHATTGETVSRTGNPLNTVTSSYAAVAGSIPAASEVYYTDPAGVDTGMSCMSCHDVHTGATDSAGYLLKEGATAADMGAGGANAAVVTGVTLDFTDLCAACHAQYR